MDDRLRIGEHPLRDCRIPQVAILPPESPNLDPATLQAVNDMAAEKAPGTGHAYLHRYIFPV
jgi:hypothetical protein